MILDTSALAAIFFGEPELELYIQVIHDAERCRISAANFVELSMVVEGQIGPEAGRQCDVFFRRAENRHRARHSGTNAPGTASLPRFRQRPPSGKLEFRRLLRLCARQSDWGTAAV